MIFQEKKKENVQVKNTIKGGYIKRITTSNKGKLFNSKYDLNKSNDKVASKCIKF